MHTELARSVAQAAFVDTFDSRRGIFANDETAAAGFVEYYDNNPYTDFANGTSLRRDQLLKVAVERLAKEGIELVARESYPASGPEAGYTVGLIFRGDADEGAKKVRAAMNDAFYPKT